MNKDFENNLKEILEIQEKRYKWRVEDLELRNGKTFEETMEDKIMRKLKKDEIADDKWLDNHRRKAIQETEKEMLDNEIKWLQSIIDTKHIVDEDVWIIDGRIDKLKERLSKLKGSEEKK